MREGIEQVPIRVDGREHADPGLDDLHGNRVGLAPRAPFSPPKVCLVYPSFIDVDDPDPFGQLVKKGHGEPLAEHQGALRVPQVGDVLELLAPEPILRSEDGPYPPGGDVLLIVDLDVVLNLVGVPDILTPGEVVLSGVLDE